MDTKLTIAVWVRSARKHADMSQEELGAKLALELRSERGFTKANISHWETQKHSPNLEQLLAVSKITGVPLPDSLTGKIDPVISTSAGLAKACNGIAGFGEVQRVTTGNPSTDVIPVRVVGLRVQAGYPRFEADPTYDDGDTIDLPRHWVEKHQLIPNCLLAIKVRGDSMEPMIYEGEKIIINIADTKLVSGQVYAINYDGMAIVKQMVYRDREWWMHSFNPGDEYRPVMCKNGDCIIIGRLVYQPGRSLIGKL